MIRRASKRRSKKKSKRRSKKKSKRRSKKKSKRRSKKKSKRKKSKRRSKKKSKRRSKKKSKRKKSKRRSKKKSKRRSKKKSKRRSKKKSKKSKRRSSKKKSKRRSKKKSKKKKSKKKKSKAKSKSKRSGKKSAVKINTLGDYIIDTTNISVFHLIEPQKIWQPIDSNVRLQLGRLIRKRDWGSNARDMCELSFWVNNKHYFQQFPLDGKTWFIHPLPNTKHVITDLKFDSRTNTPKERGKTRYLMTFTSHDYHPNNESTKWMVYFRSREEYNNFKEMFDHCGIESSPKLKFKFTSYFPDVSTNDDIIRNIITKWNKNKGSFYKEEYEDNAQNIIMKEFNDVGARFPDTQTELMARDHILQYLKDAGYLI